MIFAASPVRACARASVGAAQLAVARQALGRHRLDHGRALHVAQLADVELAAPLAGPGDPAQERVARRLHQPLALHDPLALVLVLARARVRREHRRAGLLDLQEQRVVSRSPISRTMNASVPTEPTPTTLRAKSS